MISRDCLHMLLLAGSGVARGHNDNRCAWISDLCASIAPTALFRSTTAETQQLPDAIPP